MWQRLFAEQGGISMSSEELSLTREELYERVWSLPMQKLAKTFGLSDVGLAKLCRRHKVPVPGRGYWARLAAGQTPKKTLLPPTIDPKLATIKIHPGHRAETELTEFKQAIPIIEAASDRPITHPLAIQVEGSILRSTDEKGFLGPRKGRIVPIRVSQGQLARSIRILDAILFEIEKAGHSISWPKPHTTGMIINIGNEALQFSISEVMKSKPHLLRPHEESRPWTAPKWDYEATGSLRLSVDCHLNAHVRHWWSDGKKRRLEKWLGHFLVSLPLVAAKIREERDACAERQRRWDEERQREEETRRRREEYNRKAGVIQKLSQDWHESRRLLEFARVIKAQSEDQGTPAEQKPDLSSMADFALRHASFVDPLTDLNWMVSQFKNPPWTMSY